MKQEFRIQGMSCQHCVAAVRQALESVDGLSVDTVEIGSATFEVVSVAQSDAAAMAVADEGYPVVERLEPAG